jgi:hypothetical protein
MAVLNVNLGWQSSIQAPLNCNALQSIEIEMGFGKRYVRCVIEKDIQVPQL